jgi:hypothetical protein
MKKFCISIFVGWTISPQAKTPQKRQPFVFAQTRGEGSGREGAAGREFF